MLHRPTVAIIHLKNLVHNYRVLRGLQKSQELFFCPMIKADAYGHGDLRALETLYGLGQRHFGVATLEEAMALRKNFLVPQETPQDLAQLLVFSPLFAESLPAALEAQITFVLSSWRELENLVAAVKLKGLKKKPRVHLKFNTGMARLGFEAHDAIKLAEFFKASPNLELEGVCTHLAEGEDAHLDTGFSSEQIHKFAGIESQFAAFKIHFHALNSAGLVASSFADLSTLRSYGARPGLSLYGVKPALHNLSAEQHKRWSQIDLRPVLQLETQIILTRELKAGESVSYNRQWTSQKDSLIAILPMGYADGYHRRLSNKGRMLIEDQWVPVVGTVCMDYTLVDVSALRDSHPDLYSMRVTVIGQSQTQVIQAQDLAEFVGTNAYEILTSVSRRVPRVYK